MKLCVRARQEPKYLDYAEEIIFEYRDREAIIDFVKKYPSKTMILTCYEPISDINWSEISNLNLVTSSKFIMKIKSPLVAEKCNEEGIKFYFAQYIKSYDELDAVLKMNPQYVKLGAPLFFDMDNIKDYHSNAQVRLVPNIAYDELIPRQNGIVGTWIRPEDIMMYDEYASTIEFEDVDLPKERALIRIYWEAREWPGEIEMIISNFNHDGVNRLLTSGFTDSRLNCRQICKKRKGCCSICYRHVFLANEKLIRSYKDAIDKKYEAPLKEDN